MYLNKQLRLEQMLKETPESVAAKASMKYKTIKYADASKKKARDERKEQ